MDSLYLVASEKPKFTQSHLQNTLILLPWCPHIRQSTGLVFLLPKCKQSKLNILPKKCTGKGWCSKSNVYGALPNFKGNESRDPSSVPKSKTETSATTGGAAQGCSRIMVAELKDLFIVRRVKESHQKTSSWWSANNWNPLIPCCSSRTQSFFVSSR